MSNLKTQNEKIEVTYNVFSKDQKMLPFGSDNGIGIRIDSNQINEYDNDNLEGAIIYLEKKFPLPSAGATADLGGGLQHHLRDFSHHPTIVGLVFSIYRIFKRSRHYTIYSYEIK
ncbi:MAG: hypothetical protein RBR71_01860 [Gudongella sp.]|nr:hypothetical protein [Gudongella sp.]